MRHTRNQVAEFALVVQPGLLLASVGTFADLVASAALYVARQYGAIDILPAADRFGVARTTLLSADGKPVASASGLMLPVAGAARGERPFDVVVLCDREEAQSDTIDPEWFRAQADAGATIAASGVAVGDLAASGLLDGRVATAPWWLREALRSAYPEITFDHSLLVSEEGDLLCSAGPRGDAALALRLIERVTSTNLARWLARRSLIDRPEGAMQRILTPLDLGLAPLVNRAQHWLEERFSQPVRIEELASAMEVSRRTLARHFADALGMSPLDYLQMLRVEAAKRMLERTAFTIERIAGLVGYSDAAAFRHAFARASGKTPRAWRTTARG